METEKYFDYSEQLWKATTHGRVDTNKAISICKKTEEFYVRKILALHLKMEAIIKAQENELLKSFVPKRKK